MSVSVMQDGKPVKLAGNSKSVGISGITKTGTSGDVDTYRIALTNGTYFDFNVTNGADGVSIVSFEKDENDNIIANMSDGTTKVIGKVSIDLQGNFLTENGIGNLRYYNNRFQYYNTVAESWVDTVVTPDNPYIINLVPQPMQSVYAEYDQIEKRIKLKWLEPADTMIDGQVAVIVDRVVLRRKIGSIPENETDGELVMRIKRSDFGAYSNRFYTDNFVPVEGTEYYYKFFPISTTSFVNNASANEIEVVPHPYELYGFVIDQTESDPQSMIEYTGDNESYQSARMDYTNDVFNYGDWGDAWFIKKCRPCMLKYDGTVDYYLDPNDPTKKENGTESDIANTTYAGNAMVEFPKVYIKFTSLGEDKAKYEFSDAKLDDDYRCYAHLDKNGNEMDYCYMPMYTGSIVDKKMRSLSGRTPMASYTASQEINYAKANNLTSDEIWNIGCFSDWQLINLLLLLIGKSTDAQTIFGSGNNNSYVSGSNTGVKATGTMNTKGMFWGNQDNKTGVKVFYMEHYWGNQLRRINGWINDKGTQKIKMTYSQEDGSTVDGYNLTGSGYITISGATPSGTSAGYIGKVKFTENGLIPYAASGSDSTYYCDGLWFNNSQVDVALVGGGSNSGLRVGALCSGLNSLSSDANWNVAAALSCKPLAA